MEAKAGGAMSIGIATRKDVCNAVSWAARTSRSGVPGYGTSALGDVYGTTDPAESTHAVHFAIDNGINLFDSSPYCGLNLAEQRRGDPLGQARRSSECGNPGRRRLRFP